ncbi:CUGBP Elav-like family member 1 [Camellia lanceoleosa]|uniref:CUGBP Elav-like family member 1 n=1 Tax=Camellia lanceoleosa TaxID=1840588 RepID=A0ACC0I4J7_9ERIC|nr:CUGBP Elav-like family member 1 [Camellia lanceoleosa]
MERQQGGWNPVFRRRQGRNGAAAQLHTIFVDEIPHSMNPKDLYIMFSNFGMVKDVYIPDKCRKATKTRFGFVRYDYPVAAEIAIRKANGVWCGDKSLKGKKEEFEKGKNLINPRPRAYKPDRVSILSGAGIGGRHSYADVLKGGRLVILEKDGRSYPVRVVEARDLLTTSMVGGDHCSATQHTSRSEDDDVGNIGADVERSLHMAHSKKSKEVVMGVGHKHTCPLDSVSMVNETGVEIEIRNHDAVHPARNVSSQAPLDKEVDKGVKRGGVILETPIGPHGLIRSLNLEDFNRPDISLQVVLSKAQFDGICLGPNKAKISSVQEANPIEEGEASDNIEDESSPSDEEEEIHQPGASVWDSKAATQLNESRVVGKFWRKKGQKGISFRNGFQ